MSNQDIYAYSQNWVWFYHVQLVSIVEPNKKNHMHGRPSPIKYGEWCFDELLICYVLKMLYCSFVRDHFSIDEQN